MRAADSWDYDWDSGVADDSPQHPAPVDPNFELQPLAVDESLTSLLFAGGSTPAPAPAIARSETAVEARPSDRIEAPMARREPSPEWSSLERALFETV